MQYNIAIVENDLPTLKDLLAFLERWSRESKYILKIGQYESTGNFLLKLDNGLSFDAIFLNIDMNGVTSGFELSKIIRRLNNTVAIVLLSNSTERIADGYSVSALQYLVKPIAYPAIQSCMNRIAERIVLDVGNTYRFQKSKNAAVSIPYSRILYFTSAKQYVHIHTVCGRERQLERMKNVEGILPNYFIRCHRSYIINTNAIYSLTPTKITLLDGSVIPLGKKYFSTVKMGLEEYQRWRVFEDES